METKDVILELRTKKGFSQEKFAIIKVNLIQKQHQYLLFSNYLLKSTEKCSIITLYLAFAIHIIYFREKSNGNQKDSYHRWSLCG